MKSINQTLAAGLLWLTACGAAWAISSNPDMVEDFYRDTVLPILRWDGKPMPAPVGEDLKVTYEARTIA
jgi:hypothetical protein